MKHARMSALLTPGNDPRLVAAAAVPVAALGVVPLRGARHGWHDQQLSGHAYIAADLVLAQGKTQQSSIR